MTPLALFLFASLLWCLVLFFHGILYRPRGSDVRRSFLRLHVAVLGLLAVAIVATLIGFDEFGSRFIPRHAQRRVEHRGFYSGPGGRFVFSARPADEQFPAEALRPDETITLRPVVPSRPATGASSPIPNPELPRWTLAYRAWASPLRVDREVVNVNADWWLSPGDVVYVDDDDAFFAVRVEADSSSSPDARSHFTLTVGSWRDGSRRHVVSDRELFRRALRDGISLGAILRAEPSESADAIAFLTERLQEAAESITFVRQRRSDTGSRLGLLIDVGVSETGVRLHKNDRPLTSPFDGLRVESPLRSGSEIAYGLGDGERFAVTIPREISNSPEVGPVVRMMFVQPTWWPLPQNPADEVLISSREEDSPKNGYWVDTGSPARPFYAKARFSDSLDDISVNTGSARRSYALNENLLLGDRTHGAIVALTDTRQGVPYAGLIAVIIIVSSSVALGLLLPPGRSVAPRILIATVLTWELAILAAVTRLVLSFRASLLPPADPRFEPLFHESLVVSLCVLAAVPAVAWLPLASARARQRFFGLPRPASPTNVARHLRAGAAITTVLAAYVLVAYATGRDSLLLRVNHATVIASVAVLAISAPGWARLTTFRRLGFVVLLSIPLLINVALMDRGSYTYLLVFALVAAVQMAANRSRPASWRLRVTAVGAVLVIMVFPLIATWIGRVALRQRQIGPGTETLYYRLVAQTNSYANVLRQEIDDEPISERLLLRNVHQNWQILQYSTIGAREPVGYGRAPISNRGMSYPVSLTDAAFSQLLLVEHGALAGIALVGIFVLFGCVCIHTALFLPDRLRHRTFALVGLGSTLSIGALYMASGNIGLAVFTGLNVPLMGLYSWSDALFGGAIFALAAWLIAWNTGGARRSKVPDRPLLSAMLGTCIGASVLWLAVFTMGIGFLRTHAADPYLADYRLDGQVVAQVKDHLNPSADRNPCWILSTARRLEIQPGCVPLVIEQLAVEEFNRRVNKTDPRSGLIYLEGRDIVVNDNYFTIRSPFKEPNLWRGVVLNEASTNDPGFVVLGEPLTMSLSSVGAARTVFLDRAPVGRFGSSVLIAERPNQDRLVELIRDGAGHTIISSKHVGAWTVLVDGDDVDGPTTSERSCGGDPAKSRGCRQLNDGDIIVLERRANRRLERRYNLLFLSKQSNPVMFTKWVNGAHKHIFPKSSLSALGYSLAHAMDQETTTERPPSVTLTVDPELHANLQQALERFARRDSHYRRSNPLRGHRIAVSVLDPHSGKVLALPVWPPVNARARNFTQQLETVSSNQQYRLLQNANLTNHAVGSTIKPLVFASVASALWPAYRLDEMVVFNDADVVTVTGSDLPVHPHATIADLQLRDYWDCKSSVHRIDARTYLIRSLNYYQATVGLIGMFQSPQDWALAMIPSPTGTVQYRGQRLALDAKRLKDFAFVTQERYATARTESMKSTLLFSILPKLFSAHVAASADAAYATSCNAFAPALCDRSTGGLMNQAAMFSVPEPVLLQPQDFQELGQTYIRGFLIGGALSRWNNVRMAESFSRLATGLAVHAHIESGKARSSDRMPLLPGDRDWTLTQIVEPLEDVVEDIPGQGTAVRLANAVPSPYAFIAKTGTIEEGNLGRESELLAGVVGARQGREFQAGRTLAFYSYMEQSKPRDEKAMKKFALAKVVLRELVDLLDARAAAPVDPQPEETPPADAESALPAEEPPVPPKSTHPASPPTDASGLEGMLERTLEAVVRIESSVGTGTGFFAGTSCRVVTNLHVVDRDSSVNVIAHDGTVRQAQVIGTSPGTDLAVLSVPTTECVSLQLERRRPLLGQDVFAIGHPFGLNETISRGIVSAMRDQGGVAVIQTDAAINPGNSGGPLINSQGLVIGITTSRIEPPNPIGRRVDRLSFAVSVSELLAALGHLIK